MERSISIETDVKKYFSCSPPPPATHSPPPTPKSYSHDTTEKLHEYGSTYLLCRDLWTDLWYFHNRMMCDTICRSRHDTHLFSLSKSRNQVSENISIRFFKFFILKISIPERTQGCHGPVVFQGNGSYIHT